MTSALFSLESALLVALGWTVLLVLWESAAIALLLAAWRLVRANAPSAVQHRAAALALAATVLAAGATPLLMRLEPAAASPSVGEGITRGTQSAPALVRLPAVTPAGVQRIGTRTADATLPWLGLGWCAGAGVLAVRLLTGWLGVRRLRRHSRPIHSTELSETVARLSTRLGVRTPVALLETDEIEAPIVVGARHPALILPAGLTARMPAVATESLLAHELWHVVRGDYYANLWQSAADAVLFFSPAARWISARVREAREFDCDDAAAAACGDRARYAEALTALVSLGRVQRMRPVVGASGPRLVTRIRRLLEGHALPRFVPIKMVTLCMVMAALIVAGRVLADVSFAHAMASDRSAGRPVEGEVPLAWVVEQPGSSVQLGPVKTSDAHLVGSVTIRNMANVDITALTFAIVAEDMSIAPGLRKPVRILTMPAAGIAIRPGASADIPVNRLTPTDIEQLAAAIGSQVQVTVGLQQVEFENRWVWEITPNPAARTSRDALSLPAAEIGRPILGVLPQVRHVEHSATGIAYEELVFSGPSFEMSVLKPARQCGDDGCNVCYDEQAREYSEGAIAPIRREPGRFARCEGRQWVEVQVSM